MKNKIFNMVERFKFEFMDKTTLQKINKTLKEEISETLIANFIPDTNGVRVKDSKTHTSYIYEAKSIDFKSLNL